MSPLNGNTGTAQMAEWVVLIVDDEPDNLGVPSQLLTHYGATVHIASDGAEGLEVLDEIQPTIILLDLSMPIMDGWEMLKRIRALSQFDSVPVVALTAHAMVGDKERAADAGFDSYITKPFMFDTFLEELTNCMNDFMKHEAGQQRGH